MSEMEKVNLKIKKSIFGKSLMFRDIESIESWSSEELGKFHWIQQKRTGVSNVIYSHYNSSFNSLRQSVSALKTAKSRGQSIEAYINQIKNWFENQYMNSDTPLVSSASTDFKYINKLKDTEPEVAMGFLAAKMNCPGFSSRAGEDIRYMNCLLYTSPSPRDQRGSRMPSSA